MNNNKLLFLLTALILLSACGDKPQTQKINSLITALPADSVQLSFVFMGCNRMWWRDKSHSDKSMANINAMKRFGDEMAALAHKPDLFFFLGDIVSGEATTDVLDTQLGAWVQDYNGSSFGQLKKSGIELIAVPGNHELLNQQETPLAGTTGIWMKHMGQYMPKDRDTISGTSSQVNQMTYAFRRGNVAFIVMNTDTYNTNIGDTVGVEGLIPYDWVKNKIAAYRKDSSIAHIFVLGHRPFYVDCQRDISHLGMPDPSKSTPVWQAFDSFKVAAMLSAHVHQYQRMQPHHKTHQIIAGNGGSPSYQHQPPPFFGYTRIDVWASGRLELSTYGYDAPDPYYQATTTPWTKRDSADLNWYRAGADNRANCNIITGALQ
jgi:hypothetical protein